MAVDLDRVGITVRFCRQNLRRVDAGAMGGSVLREGITRQGLSLSGGGQGCGTGDSTAGLVAEVFKRCRCSAMIAFIVLVRR